jgi:glucodextranase-like protein
MNFYKKSILAILGILVIAVSACSLPEADGPIYASAPHKNEKGFTEFYPTQQFVDMARLGGTSIVTSITDDVGDDNGAGGNTVYPLTWGFGLSGTGAGLHLNDVHNVVVSVDDDNIYFDIAMANITMINEWEDPDDSSLLNFDHLFVAIYLFKGAGAGGAVTELVTYAPNDGADNKLNIACGGFGYDYTIQAVGNGGIVGKALTSAKGGVTKLNSTKSKLLDNNSSIDSASVGGLFYSALIRITVPRKDTSGTEWLTAGSWRFVMVTQDWEDYGQEASIPGSNGHCRQVKTSAGVWNFGGFDQSSTTYTPIMDMVGAGAIATNQANLLDTTTAAISGTDWINVTIP